MHFNEKLLGKTVIVTRPLTQAQNICESIERHQATVVHFPTISITPSNKANIAKQKLLRLDDYSMIFFISANAVHYAMKLAQEVNASFNSKKLVAVGPATKIAIEKYGLNTCIAPSKGFASEDLLEDESLKNVSTEKILIIRGQNGRELLREELETRGASVEYAEVYQRQLPKQRSSIDLSKLSAVDTAVLIYSGESAQNLWSLCSINEQQWLSNSTIIVGGSRIASVASAAGFAKKPIIAENPSDEAMLNALFVWANTS